MDFDMHQRVNYFVEKGLSESEAVDLIEFQIKRQLSELCSGRVSSLISNNVSGLNYINDYRKLMQAGLTEKEADTIYRARFAAMLSQARVFCGVYRLGMCEKTS